MSPLPRVFALLGLSVLSSLTACRSGPGDKNLDTAGVGDDDPVDADGDGFDADDDCDDDDASVNPDAEELCDDTDNNCDGEIDEGVLSTFFGDEDGDGWGAVDAVTTACTQPEDHAAESGDCDDSDSAVFPGADEVCNGVDDNCDGDIDEDAALDASTWYADTDLDGYGDASASSVSCESPSGSVLDGTDCDDTTDAVNPGADEVCNGVDDNCDGDIDEDAALDASTWYADTDLDGYGDASDAAVSCESPSGSVTDATDCDDTSDAVFPGADEVCNGVDDNCDGDIDEDSALDASTWYADTDLDGYGDAAAATVSCVSPSGAVSDATDCDDTDIAVFPGAEEVCNGVDDNCDGDIDEDAALDASTWYVDTDLDGYGDVSASSVSCAAPSGSVADATDCDDTDDAVNPGATEICNGIDDDCDGTTDADGSTDWTTYDADGDGTYNCVDPSPYAYDYDDEAWTDWATVDLGGGNASNWHMSGGTLYEVSNAALSIAYGPDLGEMAAWTLTADTYSGGAANNGFGLVFDYVDSSNYWIARWLDPNDYYASYASGGRVDLYRCVAGTCSALAADDGSADLSASYSTWVPLSVSVDGDDISISLDGVTVVTHTATGEGPIGAGTMGVWTYDNDSGAGYDDFEVTVP